MSKTRLILVALLCGAALAFVPSILPAGADAELDASQFLSSGHFFLGAAIVFAGGLLTALTPCVYPLIPITVSVFGARKAESRGKSLLLTSAYVVGMGMVFSALGVAAAKTGQAFGSVLGSPAVVIGLAIFLLVLASSMFGAFELAVPSGLQQRLNTVGGSGLVGAFLMGSVSGFLAAPCTGPVLTGLLAFVAKTQSVSIGAGLLFIYALGIGVPFFAIGALTLRLPKGGVWMEWVKSLLGVMLVALAASYLKDASPSARERLATGAAQLGQVPGAVIAGVAATVGVLLGAIHLSFKGGVRQFVLKGVAVCLVVAALVVRIAVLNAPPVGALWVRLGLSQPVENHGLTWSFRFAGTSAVGAPTFDQQLDQARAAGKPVMIDFFADWCAACKELDRETYVSPDVVREASRFVNIKVDATNEEDAIVALYQRFGVTGLPTVAFVSSRGELLPSPRVTGFMEPNKFVGELRKVR